MMGQMKRRPSDDGDHVDKVMMRKKSRRKVMRIRLEHLFDSCKKVFLGRGTVPSAADVRNLCSILDDMKPEDVGLSRDLQFFKPKTQLEGITPRVTSATIYKSDHFELCIFFLPASAVIPLHNHPEMTVFSKLLLGTMHIKSYDWVDPLDPPTKLRLAKIKADATFTAPCKTSVLYPTSGGNIHEFTAITPCAVLDVIGPPYSKDDGRDCSYYRESALPISLDKEEDDGRQLRWLEEIEIPKESEMDGIEYMGPKIYN